MKRISLALAALALATFSTTGSAQSAKPVSLGLSLGASIPVGDFGDVYSTGYNGTVSLGFNSVGTPLGIRIDEQHPRISPCIRCNTCDGFPCVVHSKSDAEVMCIGPALQHPNVTLLTNAMVTRLDTSGAGREVTSVHVRRDGASEAYTARIVVVSCGAINSAALLLRSAGDKHPNGLANASDSVGRHYMGHINSVVLAVSLCPNPTVFQSGRRKIHAADVTPGSA